MLHCRSQGCSSLLFHLPSFLPFTAQTLAEDFELIYILQRVNGRNCFLQFCIRTDFWKFCKEILSLLIPSGEMCSFGMQLLFVTCEAAFLWWASSSTPTWVRWMFAPVKMPLVRVVKSNYLDNGVALNLYVWLIPQPFLFLWDWALDLRNDW